MYLYDKVWKIMKFYRKENYEIIYELLMHNKEV